MVLADKEKHDRVRKAIEENGLDALLVKLPENVLYLSNWWPITGWGAVLFPVDGDPVVFVPDTESLFAEDRTVKHMVEYSPTDNKTLIEKIKKSEFGERRLKVGVELTYESVACTHLGYELAVPNTPFFDALSSEIKNWELKDAVGLLYDLRAVKSELDFKNLAFVNELNRYGLEAAAEAVKEEKTEMEIATICEKAINDKIADYGDRIKFIRAFSFVMAGPEHGARACWPYNISTGYRMKRSELCMMELNTQVNGYWSDLTRTWVVGRNPTDRQKDMMDTINTAIERAIKAAVPGTPTTDVDKASRDYINGTEWGKYHTPFLGHGIGVKLHEPIPMLYPGSPGTVEIGHYFTVEPGLYGKEIGGALRIERNVFISKEGIKITDNFPCEL